MLQDVEKIIHNVTSRLEARLNEVFTVLNQTKNIIENYFYQRGPRNLHSAIFECLKTKNVLTEYEVFNMRSASNNSYSEENFSVDLGKFMK